MNRETTDKIIVYAKTRKVDNTKIRKTLFVNLLPLYVTEMRYLELEVNVSFHLQFSGE